MPHLTTLVALINIWTRCFASRLASLPFTEERTLPFTEERTLHEVLLFYQKYGALRENGFESFQDL